MFTKRFNFIRIAGINIGIDLSWLFIAILLSWTLAAGHFPFVFPGLPPGTYWLLGVVGMLGLFVCILLHELGHALVAKYYKVPIDQITLFLFGGVAEIKKEPSTPKVEFLIAIAGPIVTFLLACLFLAASYFGELWHWSFMITGITSYLAFINALILAFNMIPAFPLDGGRILRAILWKCKNDFGWATKISSRIGATFAFFLIFFGIFTFISGNFLGGIWLTILGLFLQKAASSSQTQFLVSRELRGETVSKFMISQVDTVSPDLSITGFVNQHLYRSHHHLYPVIENENLLGYISVAELRQISQEQWNSSFVRDLLIPLKRCATVSPQTSAEEALRIMQTSLNPTLLVVHDSKLAGLLTSQDLFKIIALKLKLEESRKQ